jgi:2-methylisocitrate lyase-like PEP mutase family enzyme
MTSTAEKAALLTALHVPGDPLIVTNIWDAITARIVAGAPGVKALATASHAVSFAHGVPDNEGLSVEQALRAAQLITQAVELPVSVDFEKGYAADAAGVLDNVAPRRAADDAGVPLAINARVDSLVSNPADWAGAMERANRYLDAGATSIFVLRLPTEGLVERAVRDVKGPVSVVSGPTSVSLPKLAELGVARVSFGPGIMGLTLAHLRKAATTLTARGAYPEELGFEF